VSTKGSGGGRTGTWLIDPNDYFISDPAYGGDIAGSTLGSNLESTNVVITSDDGATLGNGDIFINDAISWSANNSLTLLARRNVEINNSINGGGDLLFFAGWDGVSTTTPVVTSGVGDITSFFNYAGISTRGNIQFDAGQDILLGASLVRAGNSAFDGLDKSVKLIAGRNIALTNPDGGTQVFAIGNNGSAATVILQAKTGSITIQGSEIQAGGGSAGAAPGGMGTILINSAADTEITDFSLVRAYGGYGDGGGGAAAVTVNAGGGLLVRDSDLWASGGSGGSIGQGGAASVNLFASGPVQAEGAEGSAWGGSGAVGGDAAINVVAGGNVDIGAGTFFNGDLSAYAGGGAPPGVSSVVVSSAGNVNLNGGTNIYTDGVVGLGGVNIALDNAYAYGGGGASVSASGSLSLTNGSTFSGGNTNTYINTLGDVLVDNSHIYGYPDVVMDVGGVIKLDNSGTIEAGLPATIYVHFPMLASGGYFVNGVEGVVFDASTGFFTDGSGAILDSTLFVTYGGGLLPPPLPPGVIPEVLTVPTEALYVAMGESITPPEPEKDKNIFSDLDNEKKRAMQMCR